MFRKGKSLVVLSFLILSFFSLTIVPDIIPTACAKIIYVDDEGGSGPDNPPENYTSINAAIAAASPGDTVFIYSGNYDEAFSPENGIKIIGENPANTTITSTSSWPTCYVNWAGSVYLENLTIIGAPSPYSIESSAIEILRDSAVTVRNCRLINSSIYGGNNGVSEQKYIRVFTMCSAVLLNTTHGNGTMVESGGSLTLKWYLNVRVINRNGNPIENSHILVNDTFNNNIFDGYSDSNGYVRWIICTERKIPGSNYNPYHINVSKDGKKAKVTVTMNRYKEVWILLDDFTLPLYTGWNLISIPIIHYNTDINHVLSSISGSYDLVQWYNPITGNWQDSNGDLTQINHKMAIWIHMINDDTLINIEDRTPIRTEFEFQKGWNFVSYPSLIERTISNSFSSINGSYTAVKIYNESGMENPWKGYNVNKPQHLNDLNNIQTGQGFLIYITHECYWTVDGT
jgi:hypothetical protein